MSELDCSRFASSPVGYLQRPEKPHRRGSSQAGIWRYLFSKVFIKYGREGRHDCRGNRVCWARSVGLGEAGDGIMAGCRCSLRDRLRSVALV